MKRALAILVSLALLAWLVSDGRWRDLLGTLDQLSPGLVLVALAGFACSYLLRAIRIWDEFRAHATGRFPACLRIVLIHNAMVNVVPFRGGEAAFPLLLKQTFGTPLPRALASLFWFRLQDAFAVFFIAACAWPGLPLWLRVAALAGLAAFAAWLPRWARAPHDWHGGSDFASRAARLRDTFAETTRHARLGWLWTAANWSVKLLTQAWLLGQLVPATLQVGAAGALGAELAAILPIQGVAGFGTYEAGAAAAMLPSAVAMEDGLRAAFALHIFVIASAVLAGAIAWLFHGPRPSTPQESQPSSR
ncbi:MAG: flippase-like domain-containing protein [Rhodocyclaceae bacterium]|nr:flippase-like domain-containing protein [Rhodocyclaceae bacterium]